jgi:hypothetical protein
MSKFQHNKPKKKRVKKACEACRRRKSKCSGTAPCTACQINDLECVIDLSSDMRRKTAMQRYLEERRIHAQTLEDLAGIIRQNEVAELAGILERVRLAPTLLEAAGVLREEVSDRRDALSDTAADAGRGRLRATFRC